MEDNMNNKGAPSSDNTSALFVSARKKQLAQQEEERVAAEKEAARLAAEEEVRRLELEVEERRRKAQEDAMRVEQEAQERRKLAEQERLQQEKEAKMRGAQYQAPVQYGGAQNAAPVQNAQAGQSGAFTAPVVAGATAVAQPIAGQKANDALAQVKVMVQDIIQDKKKLGIAIGAIVGFIVIIILLSALGGGGASGYETAFVNNGDPEMGYFNLYDDGTADGVSILGDEFEGTWAGGGGALAIYVNDIEFAIYNVIDDYTYEDALTGAYYYYYPAIDTTASE